MQAVDEQTSKQIKVTPLDIPEKDKPEFQPTSKQGVSFPVNEKTPTIIVRFGKPAEVHSVTIPRDQTPGANVQQFQVTFYSPNNKTINEQPIFSTLSPKDDKNKPAHLETAQIPSDKQVSRVEITILQTTNGESPKGVVIDIKACTEITTGSYLHSFCYDFAHLIVYNILGTTGLTSTPSTGTIGTGSTAATSTSVTSQTGSSTTSVANTSVTATPGSTSVSSGSPITTGVTTGTTTKQCEEMQAVNEDVSKQIKVTPIDVPQKDKPEFQPASKQGVSFPENEKTPTIIVYFGTPAEVRDVTIPRNTTPGANVEQFTVTFYSADNKTINEKPISSTSSPKDDKNKPAHLKPNEIPSNTPVSRIEITIIHTTDDKSPKGVILDIKACTEITTG
jgi:hypothetical protein